MTYQPKAWVDGSDGGTPILATDLNHVEQGLAVLDETVDDNAQNVAGIASRVQALENGLSQTNQNFDALFAQVQALESRVAALETAP